MPSEHRLHPLSFLFGVGAHLKDFALPLIVLLVTAGRSGLGWQGWFLWLLIPYVVVAIGRTLSFSYHYDEHEMVIRTGFFFRNERHVPYARIQSVDGVQTVLHRLLNVVDVKVQTAGGKEPEAIMSVLRMAAFEEMRRHVSDRHREAGQSAAAAEVEASDSAVPPPSRGRTLLALSTRELLTYGFVEGRGMVVIGTFFGIAWEFGLADKVPWPWFVDRVFLSDENQPRELRGGAFRALARAIFTGADNLFISFLIAAATIVALLVVVRLLSMAWAAIRLYGFTLTRAGDDLRTAYGLLTRVEATVPLRRIQTLTLRQGPLHRLLRRTSARVDTAGDHAGQNAPPDRHWLAPLVATSELQALVSQVLPMLSLDALEWHGVHPRAARRIVKQSFILVMMAQGLLVGSMGWWGLLSLLILIPCALLHARRAAAAMGFAVTEELIAFRSGWLWRQTTVAPFARIQAVSLRESPFDRRNAMAGVRVDTAGAGDPSHRVAIPYLDRRTADQLWRHLAHEAARRTFKWS
jgi:putative membrane protein